MDTLVNSNLKELFSNIKNDSELEIMFNNYKKENILPYHSYINVLKYIKNRSINDKLTLKLIDNLDISYSYDPVKFNIYRISISDINYINKYINGIENRNNSIIFSLLASSVLNKENNIDIIEKIKDPKLKKDINEFDIRIRLSEENKVNLKDIKLLTKLKEVDKDIHYRYKNRISLIIENNNNYRISIDLTNVKTSNNINNILNQNNLYEVEIDLTIFNAINTKKEKNKILNILNNEINKIKCVLDYNYNLIGNSKKIEIVEHYNNLLQNTKKNIYSMNVISIQSNNMVDDIIINYSVTDKADGEHFALLIYDNYIYLISSNLEVKFTNIQIKDKNYNNTILDGELIYLKNKKFLFTAFDILFYKNKDIRNEISLEKRIQMLDDVIKNVLDENFDINTFSGKYNINNILSYHEKELDKYLKYLNSLVCNKNKYIFSRKYYMFTLGLSNNEIYKYTNLLWTKYTTGDLNIWAYKLDGIIYTPLNQIYTNKLDEQKYKIYKWKPPLDNTIDFYYKEVTIDGKELNVVDNTVDTDLKNKPYRLGNLYVGDIQNNYEKPILFREEEELYKCKFYTDNGIVKDVEGNVIETDTVIECYYNKNEPDPLGRWKPLRTRYDKTHNVKKYKRKYGNFKTVANNVWKSIKENNSEEVIHDLADDNLYEKTLIKIKNNINLAQISRDKSKETYYKKKVDLAKNMRNFHNFIKSIIIYKYCYNKKILDIGVGRGGDLMKFYHSRVKSVIGLDVDSYELDSTTDGPKSRANTLKQKFPGFPKMEFGLGDAGVLFNLEDQEKNFSTISSSDKKILVDNFGTSNSNIVDNKFDVFNCQFMIHFVFKSNFTLNNFCNNLNNFMAKDGYLLITTLDGDKLHKLFKKNNGIIESFYTDDKDENKLFFRFKANYNFNNDDINKTGLSYDSYLSFINEENEYYTEYLVEQNYIIDTLKNNSNLTLVETCSFNELYDNYNLFFQNSINYESESRTKLFFMKIKEFYTKSINHEQIFSFLNRMYIFKKN